MHEVHLVRAIIEVVEKQAKKQGAGAVKRLKIRFNPLTSHSGDHVRFSFDLVKQDSPMVKDAILELNEVEPLLRCNQCCHQFTGQQLPEVCPECGSVDVEAVNPTDMVLESFEITK